jgi:hypothetical protein
MQIREVQSSPGKSKTRSRRSHSRSNKFNASQVRSRHLQTDLRTNFSARLIVAVCANDGKSMKPLGLEPYYANLVRIAERLGLGATA